MLETTRLVLAFAWVSLMLIYLLGDVLRVFAGHAEPGTIDGKPAKPWMWALAACIQLVPIAMILVTMLTPAAPLVWITVVVSALSAVFNLVALPYKGAYDNMLIVVSIVVNAIIIWQAVAWSPAG
jgi:hypothetical protein